MLSELVSNLNEKPIVVIQLHLVVTRCAVVSFISLISTIFSFAQEQTEDRIRGKLEKAQAVFDASLEKHRATVIRSLDARLKAARDKGDKKGVEEAIAMKESFAETDKTPNSIPASIKDDFKKARKRLEDAFNVAIREYTKAGRDNEAALVEKELKEFLTVYRIPKDAVEFQGKFYKLFNENVSWHQARSRCEEMGGRLAVVENAEINEFLVTQLEKSGIAEAFLGATDEAREGEWQWVTNVKMSYSNWGVWNVNKPSDREPNNYTGNEHYLVLVARKTGRPDWRGKWADALNKQPNGSGLAFICQWD